MAWLGCLCSIPMIECVLHILYEGTSDEHITVVENLQGLNPDGAVLVSTPQVRRWCVCVCAPTHAVCMCVSVYVRVNVCMLGRGKDSYTSVSFQHLHWSHVCSYL